MIIFRSRCPGLVGQRNPCLGTRGGSTSYGLYCKITTTEICPRLWPRQGRASMRTVSWGWIQSQALGSTQAWWSWGQQSSKQPAVCLNCVDTQDSGHLILGVMYNEIRQEVQQPSRRSRNPFTLGECCLGMTGSGFLWSLQERSCVLGNSSASLSGHRLLPFSSFACQYIW